MPDLVVLVSGSEGPFGAIPLTILEDPTLSWKAKGLWTYLRCRPPGWQIREQDLVNRSTDGRDANRSAVRELEDHDPPLLKRERMADGEGRYAGWLWTILGPTDGKPVNGALTENPSAENPSPYIDAGVDRYRTDDAYASPADGAGLVLTSEDDLSPEHLLAQRSARLLAAFVTMYGGKVDARTRGRWGACCKRLVAAWTDQELHRIAIGMRAKFPWSEGEPFDPFDTEKNAAKALALSNGGMGTAAEAGDAAWEAQAH